MLARSYCTLLVLPLLFASGCYRMALDASALSPDVYLTSSAQARAGVQPLGEFEARTTASWLFWGLLPLKEPQIEAALQRELARAGANAVTGLEIRTQNTFVDGLVRVLTFGIYGQRTTFLGGQLVRTATAALDPDSNARVAAEVVP